MNSNTFFVIALIAVVGFGFMAYSEDTRCTKDPTPSCHYTLRDKSGPL